MTVWIAIATISYGGVSLNTIPDVGVVYANKATCEWAIEGTKSFRCLEMQVVSIPR